MSVICPILYCGQTVQGCPHSEHRSRIGMWDQHFDWYLHNFRPKPERRWGLIIWRWICSQIAADGQSFLLTGTNVVKLWVGFWMVHLYTHQLSLPRGAHYTHQLQMHSLWICIVFAGRTISPVYWWRNSYNLWSFLIFLAIQILIYRHSMEHSSCWWLLRKWEMSDVVIQDSVLSKSTQLQSHCKHFPKQTLPEL